MTNPQAPAQGGRCGGAILSLVTCGPQLEVGLMTAVSQSASLVRLAGIAPRSTLVLAAVDLLVEDAGITPADLENIVVSRGPGSFTGIRAGLATASGLAVATGAGILAYDSLLMLASRCAGDGTVWAAQPGRRGEVYARGFRIAAEGAPEGLGEIEVVSLDHIAERGPWVAAETLELGTAERALTARGSAEALLHLAVVGHVPDEPKPLYVEGPPIHRGPA
jgi:tRNA threonylcarbamoyl adenosine modification protein YeaZ